MTKRLYKARTITGAQARVRRLEQLLAWYDEFCREQNASIARLNKEADLLARLAASRPTFSNPREAWAAEELRDRRLAGMGLAPDGNPLKGSQ